ncbi:hypothetical protein [Paraglaciecola sp. L3A3]|uniref:hypothetical protein n=1 Tax=Paraglaciecola sp. L3A3 TaxID=2686358 RepID=UPI00131B02FB|nr:hypothetical protein [Paraglaciecola sp. L3A3]
MKRTKYDINRSIYESLISKLNDTSDPQVKRLIGSWTVSLRQMDSWLSDPKTKIKKSALATGLEQGLMDAYLMLIQINNEESTEACRIFLSVCENIDEAFILKRNNRISKILSRGKIRNEQDYYLIRNKIDELSLLSPSSHSEIASYDQLLYEFENKRVQNNVK